MKTTLTLLTLSLMANLSFAADHLAIPQKTASKNIGLTTISSGKSKDLGAVRANASSGKNMDARSSGAAKEEASGSASKADQSQMRGGQEGNGGAGITRNGNIMTFYSAGVKIIPRPKLTNEIPTMEDLIQFFANTDVIDNSMASHLLEIVTPSDKHQYFDVDQNYFTSEVENRLRSEYAKVTGQNIKDVILFAITDTKTNETYLLPSFYKLQKASDKMAILAHESMWIHCPNCQAKNILNWENLYQAHFENPNDPQHAYSLAASFGTKSSLRYAYAYDSKNGILVNDTLHSERGEMPLTIQNLLGQPYVFCLLESIQNRPNEDGKTIFDSCLSRAILRVSSLRTSFPSSLVLRWLSEAIASSSILVNVDGRSSLYYRTESGLLSALFNDCPILKNELIGSRINFVEGFINQVNPQIPTQEIKCPEHGSWSQLVIRFRK